MPVNVNTPLRTLVYIGRYNIYIVIVSNWAKRSLCSQVYRRNFNVLIANWFFVRVVPDKMLIEDNIIEKQHNHKL